MRIALLEADVSLPIAKDFIKAIQKKASGQAITKSVKPGQQVVKIVHDELVHFLTGNDENAGQLKVDNPPAPGAGEGASRALAAGGAVANAQAGVDAANKTSDDYFSRGCSKCSG